MITVYYDNLAFFFTEKDASVSALSVPVSNGKEVSKVVKKIKNNKFDCDICLYGYDIDAMFNDFCSSYKYIEAAGGVVINKRLEYLLIKRFNLWDLPKGKVEKGEATHDAAVREVCEETGLQQVEIKSMLPTTYHIYEQKGRWFFKKTYWYLMETNDDKKLIPQLDEAITEAVWMKKPDANSSLSESYRSLSDTLGFLFT